MFRPRPTELPCPGYHLRPIELRDAQAWFACVSDPCVFGPTSWPIVSTAEIILKLERLVADDDAPGRWAIADTDNDLLVGTCGAVRWDTEVRVAEVAYELSPVVWGRGLATASVNAFLAEASEAGLHRVVAHTWDGNAPSHRVLSRCGFKPELSLPGFRACRGEWRDFTGWSRPLQASS